MHQLLVVCAELNVEDLEHFRSCGASSLVGAAIDIDEDNASAAADKASAVAGKAAAAADTSSAVAETQLAPEDAVGAIEALQWSTGVLDKGVLHSLLASLPAWAVKEQVVAYRGRGKKESPKPQSQPLTFDPALWHSRMKVAEVFDTYLRSCGVAENSLIPRNSTTRFARTKLGWKKI